MNFNHCAVVFDNSNKPPLVGIITGTFNEGGGGIYVQPEGKQPVAVHFSEVTSITITA
jgi:hypothetical protein